MRIFKHIYGTILFHSHCRSISERKMSLSEHKSWTMGGLTGRLGTNSRHLNSFIYHLTSLTHLKNKKKQANSVFDELFQSCHPISWVIKVFIT